MGKRRSSRDLGIFERAMFSFMGPPELGENRAPDGYVADEAATLCHRCGRAWSEHERVHTSAFAYRRCARPQG